MKVHLGCGDDIRPGWVNVDLQVRGDVGTPCATRPDTLLIDHDLRLGLPLEPGSCEYIYSSHLLEHLEPHYGLRLLRDCFSALEPGGVLRTCLPDFRGSFSAYLADDAEYFRILEETGDVCELEPGTRTLIDHVDYGVYQYGQHRCLWDEPRLVRMLTAIGFSRAHGSTFQPDVDRASGLRRQYSIYVEAVK